MSNPGNPHAGQPVLTMGPKPHQARLAMILVHGRGASAEDIMGLAREFRQSDVAYLAPQAAGNTWYPLHVPGANREERARAVVGAGRSRGPRLDARLSRGFRPSASCSWDSRREPACRSSSRRATPRRHAAVIGLSGGLIGPPGTPRNYSGSAAGTFVFLGCSDVDPHIPMERVQETAEVFRGLGAVVDERIYRGMGHTVNRDEIEAVRMILSGL